MATPRDKDISDALIYGLRTKLFEYPVVYMGIDMAAAAVKDTTASLFSVESEVLAGFQKLYPGPNRDLKIESMMKNALHFEEQRIQGIQNRILKVIDSIQRAEECRERSLHRLAKPPFPGRNSCSRFSGLASSIQSCQRRVERYRKELAKLEQERDNPPVSRGPADDCR